MRIEKAPTSPSVRVTTRRSTVPSAITTVAPPTGPAEPDTTPPTVAALSSTTTAIGPIRPPSVTATRWLHTSALPRNAAMSYSAGAARPDTDHVVPSQRADTSRAPADSTTGRAMISSVPSSAAGILPLTSAGSPTRTRSAMSMRLDAMTADESISTEAASRCCPTPPDHDVE